jgi:hypothetical protein
MRTSVLALYAAAFVSIAASAFAVMPARAEVVYAWCAISPTGGLGQPLCHFATREQCTTFLNGLSGSCQPNARAIVQTQTGRRGAR